MEQSWNIIAAIFFLFCRYVTKLFSLRESNNWSAEKLRNLRALAYGVYEDRLDLYLQRLFLYVYRSLEMNSLLEFSHEWRMGNCSLEKYVNGNIIIFSWDVELETFPMLPPFPLMSFFFLRILLPLNQGDV